MRARGFAGEMIDLDPDGETYTSWAFVFEMPDEDGKAIQQTGVACDLSLTMWQVPAPFSIGLTGLQMVANITVWTRCRLARSPEEGTSQRRGGGSENGGGRSESESSG